MMQYEANYKTYKASVEAAEEELRDTDIKIKNITGFSLAKLLKLSELAAGKTEENRS
jgi:hypothetical protein